MGLKNKELTTLVLSLAPSEKQYFKKQFKGDADFIHLFDFMNRYKMLDRARFEVYLKKKKPSKRSISSGHLSVIKTYLKDRIMESLRVQYMLKRKPYHSLMKALNTDILMEKGLYELSLKELQEAKKSQFEPLSDSEIYSPIVECNANRLLDWIDHKTS